jgi:imidazolonepropionase-like amidohydrolase
MMTVRKVALYLVAAWFAFVLTGCGQGLEGLIAITHVNLVPMTSETILEDQTVLVSGSKIIAIGNFEEIQVPENTQVIDGEGAYLMPGLADMHMHTRADWEDPGIWPVHPLYLYLANGVTTIRDFAPSGSPLDYALQWRQEIQRGTRIGPSIYASGKLLYASPLEDPEGIVRKNHELGFDFLKLYSYLTKEDFHQAMEAAKALDMYTAGHIPYAVGLEGVLAEEVDEIAHVEELLFKFIDYDRDRQLTPEAWMAFIAESALRQFDMTSSSLRADFEAENCATLADIADQLRTAQVPVCTTMVVDDVIQLKLFQPDEFLARPENRYLKSGYLDDFQRGEEKHQVQCQGVEELCAFKYDIDRWILKGLHVSGVLLLLGTDAGTGGMGIVPGYSIHDELRILVENGFTPYEALKTGTINAGIVVERMTGEGDFGTIEIGKKADLILVAINPLEDITTIKEPLGVMAAGKWFSAEMLNQLIDFSDS